MQTLHSSLSRSSQVGNISEKVYITLNNNRLRASLATNSDNFSKLAAVGVIISVLIASIFHDILFIANPPVLSKIGTDLSSLFIYLRQFAFSELKQGNLALLNPYFFRNALS